MMPALAVFPKELEMRMSLALTLVLAATPPAGSQDTEYNLESRAAIGAHHICSGLWVVGRVTKRTADQIIAEDIAPFRDFSWDQRFAYTVDEARRTVTVRGPGVAARVAKYNGDQGCAILPRGDTDVRFTPVAVRPNLPDAATQPWPMGDADALSAPNAGVAAALEWGFSQTAHNTRAIVVVHRGKIAGERYAPGWTKDTPQISWSAGKSITAALVGILVQRGQLTVDEVAPIKEWRGKEDPRGAIRVRDLLRMSSGLDFANHGLTGPDSFTRDNKHMRIYFDGINVFEHAVNQPQELAPNTRWRYRNSDPLALGRIIKEKVETRGENYLTFPQRALFDKIGARNFVLETDAWGNFILTGFDYGSARD
ncbi:MAG TPA: serine hydrolase, partial [Vicinamibacterales bacterium]|nr:serine hydrolase [Vicinamibacterales bacterium]